MGWLKGTQESITRVDSLGIFSRKGLAYASIWFTNNIQYTIGWFQKSVAKLVLDRHLSPSTISNNMISVWFPHPNG